MYRVKMGLAQLGLSVAKMKTARRKQLYDYDAFPTTERIEQNIKNWPISRTGYQFEGEF